MKDAYYFSHDSNAQQDPKIIRLIMEMKMSGYGIFWSIVEHLRNDSDYKLNLKDCHAIAFQSHCDVKDVERVINEFGLFDVDEHGDFWSKSLMERMEALNIKRDKARTSANIRWNNANAIRTHSEGNASKVKESKVNTVNKRCLGFEEFWNKYPRKVAKPQALKAFLKISPSTELLQLILAGVENQLKTEQWSKDDGKFIPHPATWLNNRQWEDEVKIKKVSAYDGLPNQKF